MNGRILVVLLALGLSAAVTLPAVTVDYAIYVDDYVTMSIDGNPVVAYNGYGSADAFGSVDLAQGWHAIDIVFMNRWGTSELSLAQKDPAAPDYSVVSLTYLRSRDESGTQYVNGLYAEYYSLGGDFLQAVYGEGPVSAGYDGNGPLYTHYEDQINHLWAGVYNGWYNFEEILSGDIWIGADPPAPNVPEPGSLVLLGLGLVLLGPAALRRRFLRTR